MSKKIIKEAIFSSIVLLFLIGFGLFLVEYFVTNRLSLTLIITGVTMFFSIFSSIIIHELGHLIAGLTQGYKFGHFAVFNLFIYKSKGKLKVKYIKQPTGKNMIGQCFMYGDIEDIKKLSLYYQAGDMFNFISIVILALIILFVDQTVIKVILFLVIEIYSFLLYTNTILMKNYMNDGKKLKLSKANPSIIKYSNFAGLCLYFYYNGLRPRDIVVDEEKYQVDKMDWNNPLLAFYQITLSIIYFDRGEKEKCYQIVEEIERNQETVSKNSPTYEMLRQFLFAYYVDKPEEKDKVAKYVTEDIFQLYLHMNDLSGKTNTAEYYFYVLGDIANAKKYAMEAKKLLKNDLRIGLHQIIEEQLDKISQIN